MGDREEIKKYLYEMVGEEGCGMACDDAAIFYDEDGWKLQMEGFMEPWTLGESVTEAKKTIHELANMRFGLS
jgi:hypothetical protein